MDLYALKSALKNCFLHTSHCLLHDAFKITKSLLCHFHFYIWCDFVVSLNFQLNHEVIKLTQMCLWTWTAWITDKCHILEVTHLHINAQINKNQYLNVNYHVIEERCLKRWSVWVFLVVFAALNMCSCFWITACFAVCDCLLISWSYSVINLCLLVYTDRFSASLSVLFC